MSKKNLTQEDNSNSRLITIIFAVAMIVILVYIFWPQSQESDSVEIKSPEKMVIKVYNGCGEVKIAEDVSAWFLQNRDITVLKWENISNRNCVHDSTLLVIKKDEVGMPAKVRYLQDITGIKKKIILLRDDARADIEIILGKDYYKYFKI